MRAQMSLPQPAAAVTLKASLGSGNMTVAVSGPDGEELLSKVVTDSVDVKPGGEFPAGLYTIHIGGSTARNGKVSVLFKQGFRGLLLRRRPR